MTHQGEHIENLFRKKFESYGTEPSKFVWENIESKLPATQETSWKILRRRTVVSLLILLLLLFIWQFYTNYYYPEKASLSANKAISQKSDSELVLEIKSKDTVIEKLPFSFIAKSFKKVKKISQNKSREENIPVRKKSYLNSLYVLPVDSNLYPDIKQPVAAFRVSINRGCPPLQVNFINESKEYRSSKWYFGDGGVSMEQHPTYEYLYSGIYIVRLQVFGADQSTAEMCIDTIEVFQSPQAIIGISQNTKVTINEPFVINNDSRKAKAYRWYFSDNTYSPDFSPVHVFHQLGTFSIKLIAYSEWLCGDSANIDIEVVEPKCKIVFPNAFFPNTAGATKGYYSKNDDLNNDIFHPIVIGCDVVEYVLRIYNRKGILVFETNNIDIGWDGYFHGKLLPQDVYIWKVMGRFSNGKPFMKSGDVTLLHKN